MVKKRYVAVAVLEFSETLYGWPLAFVKRKMASLVHFTSIILWVSGKSPSGSPKKQMAKGNFKDLARHACRMTTGKICSDTPVGPRGMWPKP